MKKSLIAASVTLALLPWASQASDVFTLGEIDVHAPARNMLSSAHVSQSTLQLNDATTLDDLGRFVPGVYMNRLGGRNDRNLMVRGFDAKSVPLLVDGIPVYVPYDGANDMSRYTTFEYSTINVSKGTGSVLYGPNALGGAVNLVTAKPTKPFEAKVALGLKTGRSSHTLGEEGFVNLGTKQDLWYGMIDLSYVNDEGMQAPHGFHGSADVPMTNKSLVNSKHMDYKGTIKLGLTPNMTDEYSLVITHQHGDKQQPLSTNYDLKEGKKSFLKSPRFWRWPKWDKTNVYLLTHTELNEANQLYVDGKVFYSRFDNDMESWDAPNDKTANKPVFKSPDAYAPIFDTPRSEFSTYRDYSLGAGLEVGATLAKAHAVKGSFFWVDDIHRDQKTKYGKTESTVNPQIKDQDRTLTFAAEDTYTVNDKLTLVGGLAYSTRDPKKTQFYLENKKNPTESKITSYALKRLNAWDFQAKAIYKAQPDWENSIGFAKKTRFPSMKDRYSERMGKSVPNPFLKPETAYHFELNSTKMWGNTAQFQAAVFYSETHDGIDQVTLPKAKNSQAGKSNSTGKPAGASSTTGAVAPGAAPSASSGHGQPNTAAGGSTAGKNSNQGPSQMQNVGKVRRAGIELAGYVKPIDSLKLGANYTYLNSKNRTNKDFHVTNSPEHKIFAWVEWQALPKLTVYVDQQWQSGVYNSANSDTKTKSVAITDAKLMYKINDHFDAQVGVKNVFDRINYYDEDYVEEGRTFFAKLKYVY